LPRAWVSFGWTRASVRGEEDARAKRSDRACPASPLGVVFASLISESRWKGIPRPSQLGNNYLIRLSRTSVQVPPVSGAALQDHLLHAAGLLPFPGRCCSCGALPAASPPRPSVHRVSETTLNEVVRTGLVRSTQRNTTPCRCCWIRRLTSKRPRKKSWRSSLGVF